MLFDIFCMRWNRCREAMWFYQTYTQFLLHSHSNHSQTQLSYVQINTVNLSYADTHPWSVSKIIFRPHTLVHRSLSCMYLAVLAWSPCQPLNTCWLPLGIKGYVPPAYDIHFMQFSGKFWPKNSLAPHLRGCPPLPRPTWESWIRHWLQWGVHQKR